MKKINIKCEFPVNWYAMRTLKLKFDGGLKQRIYPGQERVFEFEQNPSRLSAHIDFLSQHVDLNISGDEIYLVLGMRGNNMFEWFLNGVQSARPYA